MSQKAKLNPVLVFIFYVTSSNFPHLFINLSTMCIIHVQYVLGAKHNKEQNRTHVFQKSKLEISINCISNMSKVLFLIFLD